MADARVTQTSSEVLLTGDPDARVTQTSSEVLLTGDPDARVTQTSVEVLWRFLTSAQVTQAATEVLISREPTLAADQLVGAFGQTTSTSVFSSTDAAADQSVGSFVQIAGLITEDREVSADQPVGPFTQDARLRFLNEIRYVIYPAALPDPTAAQVLAGHDANDAPAASSGREDARTTSGVQVWQTMATGLMSNTWYRVAFVWTDGVDVSRVVVSDPWLTQTVYTEREASAWQLVDPFGSECSVEVPSIRNARADQTVGAFVHESAIECVTGVWVRWPVGEFTQQAYLRVYAQTSSSSQVPPFTQDAQAQVVAQAFVAAAVGSFSQFASIIVVPPAAAAQATQMVRGFAQEAVVDVVRITSEIATGQPVGVFDQHAQAIGPDPAHANALQPVGPFWQDAALAPSASSGGVSTIGPFGQDAHARVWLALSADQPVGAFDQGATTYPFPDFTAGQAVGEFGGHATVRVVPRDPDEVVELWIPLEELTIHVPQEPRGFDAPVALLSRRSM